MPTGIELIAEERKRQIEVEGWTESHDDEHDTGFLVAASICYELQTKLSCWPWEDKWWKPSTKLRNMVKAGALLLAEKGRIDRKLKELAAEIDRIQTPV